MGTTRDVTTQDESQLGAPFDGKLVGVAMLKPSKPAFGNRALRHRTSEILDHPTHGQRLSPCAPFYRKG